MTSADTDDSAPHLGHLKEDLSFVSRILRARIASSNESFFADHQVAGGEVAVLNLIGINPGLAQKELAQLVVLRKSALTKLVNPVVAHLRGRVQVHECMRRGQRRQHPLP